MLVCLDEKASSRKLRLLCCACVRRIWYRFEQYETARRRINVAEAFADSKADKFELAASLLEFDVVLVAASKPKVSDAYRAVTWCGSERMDALGIARSAAWAAAYGSQKPEHVERSAQVQLIADIFGNPFRPINFNPAWRSPTVTSLAQATYDERILPSGELEPHRLVVLADALEEAGCTNADILRHLRSQGPHVRGCWAVDLLLAKE
jgi:hypothetical protein